MEVKTGLRDAWRGLCRAPRLVLAAIGCAGLGIAATVFVATLGDALLVSALPFPQADRLLRVWVHEPASGRDQDLSFPEAADLSRETRSFDAVEVAARTRFVVSGASGAERLRGEAVSPGYFDLIGRQPSLGRGFTADEQTAGGPSAMLVSDRFWRRELGGRPDVVGSTLTARGTSEPREAARVFTVVGVMGPGFLGTVDPDQSDFWIPLSHYAPQSGTTVRTSRHLWVLARLAPGADPQAAREEVAALGERLAAAYPDAYPQLALRAEPAAESYRGRLRPGLAVLSASALLLLLIACANVASLELARASEREADLALRLALGAPRAALLRLRLLESLLVAFAGGLLGSGLAFWAVGRFVAAEALRLPSYLVIAPGGRALLLATLAVVLTALACGLLPAVKALRIDPALPLREAARNRGRTVGQRRGAAALVAVQVTLAVALLAASALLVRGQLGLAGRDLGMRTASLVRLAVSLDRSEYPDEAARLAFAERARLRLEARPGVRAVSVMAGVLPPWHDATFDLALAGDSEPRLRAVPRHAIDERFFSVLDVPVQVGRGLLASDGAAATPVAVVSATLAAALSPGDPRALLGQHLRLGDERQPLASAVARQVVGIVADVAYRGPLGEDPRGYEVYLPIAQATGGTLSFAVHVAGAAGPLVESLRRELAAQAPTSPVHWVSTMEEELAAQRREGVFYTTVATAFAASAAVLALLGIYGVMAHGASRRVGEMAVRQVLGARLADLVRLLVGEGIGQIVVGLLAGLVLAGAGGRFLGALLYGLSPWDPWSYLGVAAGFLAAGALAGYLPARRAARSSSLALHLRA